LQFIIIFRFDEVLPAFDGKYDMNANSRAVVWRAQKMPPLKGLGNFFGFFSIKMSRLRRYGPLPAHE
jgi:hypothetical protein